jgi:Holliday junction resolvase RusA-like endonuclease
MAKAMNCPRHNLPLIQERATWGLEVYVCPEPGCDTPPVTDRQIRQGNAVVLEAIGENGGGNTTRTPKAHRKAPDAITGHSAPAPAGAVYTFELPYPPAVNNLYMTVNGRRVKTQRARDYQAEGAVLATLAGVKKILGPVKVTLNVYRPRKIGDLDGTFKVVLDCLSGVAYEDDEQIAEIHARRHEDKMNPRVEVRIEAIEAAEGEKR